MGRDLAMAMALTCTHELELTVAMAHITYVTLEL